MRDSKDSVVRSKFVRDFEGSKLRDRDGSKLTNQNGVKGIARDRSYSEV